MVHPGPAEIMASRGREAFADYLGMCFKKKVYGVTRETVDLLGLQGPRAPRGLKVLRVYRDFLGNLESSARGERKVKVDCLEWMAFLDPLVLRVYLDHQETKDTLDLLVYLVKLDFQANMESLESLVFLGKTVWTVFLEMTVLWGPGERAEQMVLRASPDLRGTMGLPDQEDLQGIEEQLVPLVKQVVMEFEEIGVFREKEDRMEHLDQKVKRETRVKWEAGEYLAFQEMWQMSSLSLVSLGNLERRERREIKGNQERLVKEGYLVNKALRDRLD